MHDLSEASAEGQPPTRVEVEHRWRSLVAGAITREEVHVWTKRWVEHRWAELEPAIENGLQTLHGFDLTYHPQNRGLIRHGGHDQGRPYVHSDQHLELELERWLATLEKDDPPTA